MTTHRAAGPRQESESFLKVADPPRRKADAQECMRWNGEASEGHGLGPPFREVVTSEVVAGDLASHSVW